MNWFKGNLTVFTIQNGSFPPSYPYLILWTHVQPQNIQFVASSYSLLIFPTWIQFWGHMAVSTCFGPSRLRENDWHGPVPQRAMAMEIPGSMDLNGEFGWWLEGPPMNCCEAWVADLIQGTLSYLDVGKNTWMVVFLLGQVWMKPFRFGAKFFARRLFILHAQVSQKLPQLLLAPIMFHLSPYVWCAFGPFFPWYTLW